MTQDQGLAGLLGRVEAGTIDSQWALVRDVTRELLDVADLLRARINGLCDHGGYESAALALCTRVLPGWGWRIEHTREKSHAAVWRDMGECGIADAKTPALALIAAILNALISQSSESGEGDRASVAESALTLHGASTETEGH